MRFFILLLFTGLSLNCFSQADECNPKNRKQQNDSLRKEIEREISLLKCKDKINEDDKKEMEKQYTSLKNEYNGIYTKIADDIRMGMLFVGEKRLCKSKYQKMINDATKNAGQLLSDLKEINSGDKGLSTKGCDATCLLNLVTLLVDYVQDLADKKATTFYETAKWKNYDDIPKQKKCK